MPMCAMSTRLLTIAALVSLAAVALGDDGDKPRRGDCDARHARIVVRDLRAQYGYHCYRSPDEARRLIEQTYRARRRVAQLERQRVFNEKDMAERRQRLLSRHEQALAGGVRLLGSGEPERAVIALTLAAKLNQGDPACRIHLAQARLALGHYREAGLALRRALELQPKLIYVDLRFDQSYGRDGALTSYMHELREWVKTNPEARPETRFLLGFLELQRGEFAAAHESLARVRRALPEDELTRECLALTKPLVARTDGR